jgi:hypothetical protein
MPQVGFDPMIPVVYYLSNNSVALYLWRLRSAYAGASVQCLASQCRACNGLSDTGTSFLLEIFPTSLPVGTQNRWQ